MLNGSKSNHLWVGKNVKTNTHSLIRISVRFTHAFAISLTKNQQMRDTWMVNGAKTHRPLKYFRCSCVVPRFNFIYYLINFNKLHIYLRKLNLLRRENGIIRYFCLHSKCSLLLILTQWNHRKWNCQVNIYKISLHQEVWINKFETNVFTLFQ